MLFLHFWKDKGKLNDKTITSPAPSASCTDGALLDAVAGAIALQQLSAPLNAMGSRLRSATEDGLRQVGIIGGHTETVADRAGAVEAHACRQAEVAGEAVGHMARLESRLVEVERRVGALSSAMTELLEFVGIVEQRTKGIGSIAHAIRDIADNTNLLALNATIEAAHAGAAGKGFGVIASEIRNLSHQTVDATARVNGQREEIERNVAAMVDSVRRVEGLVEQMRSDMAACTEDAKVARPCVEEGGTLAADLRSQSQNIVDAVAAVQESLGALHAGSSAQAGEVETLAAHAHEVHATSEGQLEAVGRLRFAAHEHACAAAQDLAMNTDVRSMKRPQVEAALRRALDRGLFELLYVTDAEGRQIVENIGQASGKNGASALNKDWSHRPWFQQPARNRSAYVSDFYRSVATDAYCLTVSIPLLDDAGGLCGVLGADVDLARLVDLARTRQQGASGHA